MRRKKSSRLQRAIASCICAQRSGCGAAAGGAGVRATVAGTAAGGAGAVVVGAAGGGCTVDRDLAAAAALVGGPPGAVGALAVDLAVSAAGPGAAD